MATEPKATIDTDWTNRTQPPTSDLTLNPGMLVEHLEDKETQTVLAGREPELPPHEDVIRAFEDAGWIKTGTRQGLYVRYAPPSSDSFRDVSVIVPLDADASDYRELLEDAVNLLPALSSPAHIRSLTNQLSYHQAQEAAWKAQAEENLTAARTAQAASAAGADAAAAKAVARALNTLVEHLTQFAGPPSPDGGEYDRGKHDALQAAIAHRDEVLNAVAPTGGPAQHTAGENAEDCPGCAGTNPPYPFICPGDDRYAR